MERLAYDAFGKRRFPNGTNDTGNTILAATTDRGYTNHEALDEVALVHMNGRIYDPVIARFTTADPTIQSPGDLQSYNRTTATPMASTIHSPVQIPPVTASGQSGGGL